MAGEIPPKFPSNPGLIGNRIDNPTLASLIAIATQRDGRDGYQATDARLGLEKLLKERQAATIANPQ